MCKLYVQDDVSVKTSLLFL